MSTVRRPPPGFRPIESQQLTLSQPTPNQPSIHNNDVRAPAPSQPPHHSANDTQTKSSPSNSSQTSYTPNAAMLSSMPRKKRRGGGVGENGEASSAAATHADLSSSSSSVAPVAMSSSSSAALSSITSDEPPTIDPTPAHARGGSSGRGGRGRGQGSSRGRGGGRGGGATATQSSDEPSSVPQTFGRRGGRRGGAALVESDPNLDDPSEFAHIDRTPIDHVHPRGRGRGRGRGGNSIGDGRGRGRGRGGRGGIITIESIDSVPTIAPVAASSPPPQPLQHEQPPPSQPASRFAVIDGVFTLITNESLSSEPRPRHKSGNNSSNSSAPITALLLAPVQSTESKAGESDSDDEERKASDMDAWFHADTNSGLVDQFKFDDETQSLIDLIGQMVDGDIDDIEVTSQSASILRYLLLQGDEPTISLLKPLLDNQRSTQIIKHFTSELPSLVSNYLTVESASYESQLVELEALQCIFSQDHEMTIFQTQPITLKITVVLQEFDCNIELGFMMNPRYPLEEAIEVSSFCPPPYQGMKIKSLQSVDDSQSGMTVDEMLQSTLETRAREMIGDSSIYAIVEAARGFMETHAQLLKTSLETLEEAWAQTNLRVLKLDSIVTFGRGRIEKQEFEAIQRVQSVLNIGEAMAKAKLISEKWDADAVLAKNSSPDSSSPPSVGTSLYRQPSWNTADSKRFEAIQSAFRSYRTDPEATLTCSACFDDFQLRELAGLVCGHVMCIQCCKRMLSTGIREGAIIMKCPGYKCECRFEEGLLMSLLSPTDYQRYRRFLQDSYIKLKNWRWCVNPKCSNVASAGPGDEFGVVACSCHSFWCFSCGRDGHWPISCEMNQRYQNSKLIQDMRAKVAERIGQIKQPNEDIKIDVKRCPKCSQPWEKNGGCNHFKCGACSYHFCWICLKEWSLHGVSYFSCTFASEERRGEKLIFSSSSIISADFDELLRFCERELTHFLAVKRLQRMINELDELKQLQFSKGTVAHPPDPQFEPELPSLMKDLVHPLPSALDPILSFALECHSILCSTYIFCAIHFQRLDMRFGPNKYCGIRGRLLYDLNQFEYFVDSLDQTLIPPANTHRRILPLTVLHDTAKAVQKYAGLFSESLKTFQSTIVKHLSQDEASAAFVVAIDQAMVNLK